jgi:hypothetical protein
VRITRETAGTDTGAVEHAVRVALDGVAVTIPRQQFSALADLTAAAADEGRRAAVARLAAVRTAVTAQLGFEEPVLPPVLAALPAASRDTVVAAVKALVPGLAVSAERLARPPVQALDPAAAHGVVLARLDPAVQFDRMLGWAVVSAEDRAVRRQPSSPVMAAPRLPHAVIDRLCRLDAGWVLGGLQHLPANSVSVLSSNPAFVEALLVGANHAFARELVWRGYPTDSKGTCLPRFWPTPPRPGGSLPDDIAPLAFWGGRLGTNRPDDLARHRATVLVIRGDLLRRYPETVVTAVYGRRAGDERHPTFEADPVKPPARELFRGQLGTDVTNVGLDIESGDLTRPVDGKEWFVALTQPVEFPRFGLADESRLTDPPPPDGRGSLSWQRLASVVERGQLTLRAPDAPLPAGVVWGADGSAGHIAAALVQLPFQLLLPASELLP